MDHRVGDTSLAIQLYNSSILLHPIVGTINLAYRHHYPITRMWSYKSHNNKSTLANALKYYTTLHNMLGGFRHHHLWSWARSGGRPPDGTGARTGVWAGGS